MAVDFNLPTVATSYTAFPTQIIENIDAALQQLAEGSPSNVPTNAIKWDKTANRWKKYNGSAYVDLTATYNLNANVSADHFDLPSDGKLKLGNSDEFTIFHQASNGNAIIKEAGGGDLSLQTNGANITFRDNTNQVNMAQFITGGSCTFKHGSNERLKTLSTGVEIFGTSLDLGDNVSLNLGTNDDFKLFHNDTDGIIENTKGILYVKKSDGSGSSQDGIKMEANSKISLFHSTGVGTNPQFETTTNGIFLRGQNLGSSLNDEVIVFDSQVALGNSGRFQIKHVRDDTTDTSWETSATRLQMRVDSTDQGYIQFNGAGNKYGVEIGTQGLEKFAYFVKDGKAELYYDNVAKLATSSNGVGITGILTVEDASGSDPTMQINHSNADVTGEFLRIGRTDLGTRYHSLKAKHGGAAAANLISFNLHNGSTTTSQTEVLKLNGDGSAIFAGNLDVLSGLDVTGGITASSTGNASLILDSGTGSQSGTQVSFIDFKLDGTVKGNIAVNEGGTHAGDLEINSAGTGAVKLFHSGASNPKLSTTANGISIIQGSQSAPSLTFGDSGTGIYKSSTNHISITVSGNRKSVVNAAATKFLGDATNGAKIRLAEGLDNGNNYVQLKAPNTIANNLTLTLPDANPTVAGYALISTDTSGTLSWGVAGGVGAKGGGSDEIFWENGQAVTTNYTITNGKNAGSFGPITINSGVTVTIGDGETWSVV